MKISGFTIIRNAVVNDYPIVEAITSILPIVDEMIVLIGDSNDETRKLIEGISSDKIKLFESVWDKSLRRGGAVLAVETDKAFELIDPESTWAFYIQADEVVHEQYLPLITDACTKYKDDKNVEGLLFRYFHFYGSYDYVGDSRKWYNKEIRIIRNDKTIKAYKDAQGFRKGKTKLNVKFINACIYHYGWVKSPGQMRKKMNEVSRFWNPNVPETHHNPTTEDIFDFKDFDSLQLFDGGHPAVMKDRIASQNWKVTLDLNQKKFSTKDKLLYWFEKKTGLRLFDFKNYRIV